MPKKAKYNHTHKYQRRKLGQRGYEIYKCTLPGCTHFVGSELIEGRLNICHSCGMEHVIDKAASLLAKPICRVCMVERKAEASETKIEISEAVTSLLDDLLNTSVPTKYKDSEEE